MLPKIGIIKSFMLFYFFSIFVHFYVSKRIARKLNLKTRVWIINGVCFFVAMTVISRILFDIRGSNWDSMELLSFAYYLRGGLWGGMFAYLALSVPLTWALTKKPSESFDLIALSLPIPWAISKLACFLNGCCHGKPCAYPWAVVLPESSGFDLAGIPIHPVQLYEILLLAFIFALFKWLREERWRGTYLFWFISIYGLGRALMDSLRQANYKQVFILGSVTFTQAITSIASIFSIAILILYWRGAIFSKKK